MNFMSNLKQVNLGSQGFVVSSIGLGCMGMIEMMGMNTYGEANEQKAIATIIAPLDSKSGGNVKAIAYNFYTAFLKKNFDGKIKYGQQYYDFDNGTITFYAPKQWVTAEDYF